ncbi:MAG UNVERIFIED_CONTAM: hypothetical protein LOD86_07540, partial [Thermobifida fusca]
MAQPRERAHEHNVRLDPRDRAHGEEPHGRFFGALCDPLRAIRLASGIHPAPAVCRRPAPRRIHPRLDHADPPLGRAAASQFRGHHGTRAKDAVGAAQP